VSIPLLNAEAVAKVLGVSKMTVYNLAREGSLKTVTFRASGNKWTYRWRPSDLDDFVESHLREGKGFPTRMNVDGVVAEVLSVKLGQRK
jgi:excisionase family DNA binding protein